MTPLIFLFGLAFLVSVDIRILTPVLPSISASLGATPGVVGLAMTSYSDFLRSGRAQAVYLAVFLREPQPVPRRSAGWWMRGGMSWRSPSLPSVWSQSGWARRSPGDILSDDPSPVSHAAATRHVRPSM